MKYISRPDAKKNQIKYLIQSIPIIENRNKLNNTTVLHV